MEIEKNKKNYTFGKIYKVEPVCEHDDKDVYYGSTTQTLSKRMGVHRGKYKLYKEGKQHKYSIFDIFDKFGVDNCKIYLVEDFPCERKEQLEKREGEIIRTNKCVNRTVAGRTPQDYREENRQLINTKARMYRETNAQIIKQKKAIKHQCECGGNYTQDNKSVHMRTKKHQNFLNHIVVDKAENLRIRREKEKLAKSKICICECGKEYTQGHKARHLASHPYKSAAPV